MNLLTKAVDFQQGFLTPLTPGHGSKKAPFLDFRCVKSPAAEAGEKNGEHPRKDGHYYFRFGAQKIQEPLNLTVGQLEYHQIFFVTLGTLILKCAT